MYPWKKWDIRIRIVFFVGMPPLTTVTGEERPETMQTATLKPAYGIGIDTGGTYTDAVLFDLSRRAVVRSAKRPTVHHDLRQGIIDVLDDIVSGQETEQIRTIAFSTTLATNAIVEGRGADVGLIVIGQVKPFEAPVVSTCYVDGGHDHMGREVKPLDIERIVDAVAGMKSHVTGYAIAGAMSIENPAHEQVAAKAVELTDPQPVFCSHAISSRAGIRERAATAVLHARLRPVIQAFVDHAEQLLEHRHISAEIRMIHGDATAIDLRQAALRAASTVASGPAATAYFGAKSSVAKTALVVDVGGTTTDITLIKDGRPLISCDGSLIDRWRTHVDAVDMHTVGIGGDSLVAVNRSGGITVGPRRVQPLCMANGIPDPADWIGADDRNRWILATDRRQNEAAPTDPILTYLKPRGATPADVMDGLGMSDLGLDRRLEALTFNHQAREIGFTPTDALHALGKLHIGDKARSISGAAVLAGLDNQPLETFCRRVIDLTQQKIADTIIGYVYHQQTGKPMSNLTGTNQKEALLSFSFKLGVPIVGIGAAAREILPDVARRLQTQLILPPHFEVGNALGAILIARQA
ncbi:hydantoinase/oxoprolinase N-terminal domain-containing protein [Desulfosarcina ovata]|uniref:Hydantoinase n=1 Tax=Desulfosarcina ovata subsp. ovata TaxID=2752305 RepID=A0A5K8AKZ4_9BACT|nr:hydantoinase/oxoprolinase family protein [Desulfosarcina ovata]BBO92470.1 hydantoinase [Desulfosarcina ovata subsp. ovata]